MSYQSIVREVNLATGNTNRDQAIHDRVVQYNDTFKRAHEYEPIKATISDSINSTTYDSWIYSNSSYKELVRMKTILFAPGTPSDIVFSGQYIRPQRQGGTWILESIDDQYSTKLKAILGECTEDFKWYDEDGVLREYPVVVLASYKKSLDEDKYMVLTKGQYIIGIPQDENTFKLQEGDQFILNKKHKYRISGFEDIESSTFMTLTMDKYEENNEADNFELGIANYLTRPVFTLSTSVRSSQISIGNTLQVEYTLTDRDGLSSNKPVIYSSTNEVIATVSNTGEITAISNGSTTIRVSMENNQDVFDEIQLEVTATPSDNITYLVTNSNNVSDTIYRKVEFDTSVQSLNQGQPNTNDTYTFSITRDVVDDSKLTFEVIDSDTYRIINNGTYGEITINVTPDSDIGAQFDIVYTVSNSRG